MNCIRRLRKTFQLGSRKPNVSATVLFCREKLFQMFQEKGCLSLRPKNSGNWYTAQQDDGNDGRVAQLGEHLLCKQGVAGSNPVTSTNFLCLRLA